MRSQVVARVGLDAINQGCIFSQAEAKTISMAINTSLFFFMGENIKCNLLKKQGNKKKKERDNKFNDCSTNQGFLFLIRFNEMEANTLFTTH